MARIPEYQPEKLESSAVGTPGADRSGEQIGESVASTLQTISKIKAQKQAIADDLAAEAKSNDYAIELQKKRNEIHTSYLGSGKSPDEELTAHAKAASELQQSYLSQLPTQGQKIAFSKSSLGIIKSNNSSAYDQALKRQTAETQASVIESLNNISKANAINWSNPGIDQTQGYAAQAQLGDKALKTLEMAQHTLPPDEYKKLRDDFVKSFSKAAIFGAMDANPELAQKMLADKVFDEHLTIDEKIKLEDYADKLTKKREAEIKAAKEEAYDVGLRQSMQDMFDGNLTISELQRRYNADLIKESDYNMLEAKIVKPEYGMLREITFSDPTAFNEVREAQLSGSKTPGEIQRMIMKYVGQRKIVDNPKNNDASYLLNMTKEIPPNPTDKLIESEASNVRNWAERYLVRKVAKRDKDQTAEALVQEFYSRVDAETAEGPRINEIANEVMSGRIKKDHPEIARLEDVPHIVVDIRGRVHKLLNPSNPSKIKTKYKIVPVESKGT